MVRIEPVRELEKKLGKPTDRPRYADNYKLGVVYFNYGQSVKNIDLWKRADSSFKIITDGKPDFQSGRSFYYRALINSMVDTLGKTMEAKPLFEKYVTFAVSDTVKNKTELINCYDYLAYNNLLAKNYCDALMYWQKILFLDPQNKKATELLKINKGKCPEKKL